MCPLLGYFLSSLVGKTEHHVNNSHEFKKEVHEIKLEPDKELRADYVSALFTSVKSKRCWR